MHVLRFLLDDEISAGKWGAELKSLIVFLLMVMVGIVVVIWWLRRG
jgi:hypothetical protein